MILQKNLSPYDSLNVPAGNLESEPVLKRVEVDYENLSKKFICNAKDFKKQYFHIYESRLNAIKHRLIRASTEKWGCHVQHKKLSELSDENKEKCIVIGTLFKHQKLKPSILKEISEENKVTPQPIIFNYVSDNDSLMLEDEIQRIRLIGNFNVAKLITGIVIAVLGFENEDGKFEVEDMCFASPNVAIEKPFSLSEDCFILIVSGLSLATSKNMLALELFMDFVKGEWGSASDQKTSAQICRVIITGNSVNSTAAPSQPIPNVEIEDDVDTLSAVKQLDEILMDLAGTVEVDIMPGEFDPSNHLLPQQPFYECMFPKASKFESFHCVTNPYECMVQGRMILGTSGQPIDDIKSLSDFNNSLEILENTLKWGHLAPSAPDTLACYPYYNEDPFVIDNQPHFYFAGNQTEYNSKTISVNGNDT